MMIRLSTFAPLHLFRLSPAPVCPLAVANENSPRQSSLALIFASSSSRPEAQQAISPPLPLHSLLPRTRTTTTKAVCGFLTARVQLMEWKEGFELGGESERSLGTNSSWFCCGGEQVSARADAELANRALSRPRALLPAEPGGAPPNQLPRRHRCRLSPQLTSDPNQLLRLIRRKFPLQRSPNGKTLYAGSLCVGD